MLSTNYIAALELLFNKLAALGDVISDQVRRFHLIEGLSEDHSVVSSVMAYELDEGPHGAQASFPKGGKGFRRPQCTHGLLQRKVLSGMPRDVCKGEGTPDPEAHKNLVFIF